MSEIRLVDFEAPESAAEAAAEVAMMEGAASLVDVVAAARESRPAADDDELRLASRVRESLGLPVVVEASWLSKAPEAELRERVATLEREVAFLRSLSRRSRETAHRRLDELRVRAREALEVRAEQVARRALSIPDDQPPAGLGDLWALATSDELAALLHGAVDALPLLPVGTPGEATDDTDVSMRFDEATRREAIATIATELERREVEREQRALTARKKGLRSRLGGGS